MKKYNAIPAHFKPPSGFSQLQYVESFDSEFTLWLSERKSASLADIMNDAIEVEVNLTAYRIKKRDEGEWRRDEGERRKDKELEQPSTSNSQEARIDERMKTMEKLMERLTVDKEPLPREGQEQENRN